MLESVAARIVNHLLGKYVEELDTEGLNVGIFSGEVSLRNLKLKPSCLYELELPIEVGNGIIGELKLTIPWNSFSARPINITIQDLLIIAHPLGQLPYDEERDRELRRSAARRMLSRMESEHASFIQTFLNTVLPLFNQTIQLHVHNVHFRYEDISAGISVGLIVQEFSVETTNSKWKPVHQKTGGSVYQLLRLEALSLYVNTGLPRSHLLVGDDSWVQHMRTAFEQFQLKGSPLSLVVKPVNAKLKIIIGDDAPLLVDIVVQDVVLVLTHTQLTALRHTIDLLNRIQFYRNYLAKRPKESVKGNYATWWKYGMVAVLEQRVFPYTWSRFSSLRKSYKDYKKLYKRCVLQPSDTELRLDLQRIEDNLPLFCVVTAREQAKSEVFADGGDHVTLAEKQGNYCLNVETFSKDVEESQEIIEFKFNLTVDNVSLSLLRDGREVLCASVGGCVTSVESRKDEAWRVSARLVSVLIEGTTCDAELVTLVSSSTPAGSQTGHTAMSCFSIDVEQKSWNCLDTPKYAVAVTLAPLEIIYQEHAFSEMLNWVSHMEWNKFLEMDKSFTFFPNNFLLFLDLHASIALPRIIIPESGSLQKAGLVLIVDPGKWSIETELQPQMTAEELAEMTQMEVEERLYHRFQISLSDFQVLLTDSGEEWRDLAMRDESIGHMLSRMSGLLTISVSTKLEYRLLPRLKLNLAVPFIHATVSERRIEQMYQLIHNVPVPRMARLIFSKPPVLWPLDRIPPEPGIKHFMNLTQKIILTQLQRQRGAESGINSVSLNEALNGSFISIDKIGSETSDEDLELWARTVDHPGFEDNISPNNAITVLLRVTIKEFVLNLPKCVEFQERPYLMVRVGYISLDVALMEYGPAVQLAVRAFQLIDKQHISGNGEYLEMVSTHIDQDFFNLLYRKVLADCPDFKSHFHGVEESLVIDFGSVSLLLRRDAYQNMFNFLRRLKNSIFDQSCIKYLRRFWEKTKLLLPLLESRDVPVPSGGIKFSYSIHLTKLQARLRETDTDLLDITIRGFGGDWYLRANDRLILRLYLQGITLDDLSDTTLYPQIVSQDEDEVFEVKLIRLNAGTETRRSVAQGKFKLTLGRLHFLFAHHVVQTFQRFQTLFYNEFTKSLQGFIQTWAENSWLDEYRNCQRAWQLSLDLHLPVVLLPPGSTAASLFILNLGDLTVENFIKEDLLGHIVDNILIRVENTFIKRGIMKLNNEVESREEFMEHMKLQIDVKRSLTGVTGIDVVSSIDNVKVSMGQRDFALVLNLLATNHSITHIFDLIKPREGGDPFELRNLQVFLRDGNARRRDSSFRFTLDNFILTLYLDMDEQLSSPVRDLSHALCKLEFEDFVTHVETQATGLSEFRLTIKNISLNDVRADSTVLIQRIFGSRFRDDDMNSAISVSRPPLVDVVGKENECGDRCFDIFVEKTRLSISIGFIAALVKFIDDAVPNRREDSGGCDNLGYVADTVPSKGRKKTHRCVDHLKSDSVNFKKGLSLSLQLKQPELAILAATGFSNHIVGFVWRCEIFLDWSCSPGREELVLRLSGLGLTAIQPAPMVMQPCDIKMVRNVTDDLGVRMTLDISPVYLTFGSGALSAVTTILEDFEKVFPKRCELHPAPFSTLIEFEDFWSQRRISACYASFLETNADTIHNFPHTFPVAGPAESIIITVGKITVLLGVQSGSQCQPVLIGKASFKLQLQDWNSSLALNGNTRIEIACWNNNLDTWEPVVLPCTVHCRMFQSCALPISPLAVRSSGSLVVRETSPPTAHRPAGSDTDSDSDDSESAMTFIKPNQGQLERSDGLSNGLDLEVDKGILGKLHAAIVDLFVKDDGSSDDDNSDDVETDSATSGTRSARLSPTERAVFLNKHADSVDSGLDTEAVDRQAAHIFIHTMNQLRIIITPNLLTSLQKVFAPQKLQSSTKRVVNYLGPGTVIRLMHQDQLLASSRYGHDSAASTPEMTPPPSPTASRRESFSSLDRGRISPDLSYPRETLATLNEKVQGFKLNLEIPGFDPINISVGKLTGSKVFPLNPIHFGAQYSIAVATSRTEDTTHYVVSSPFTIHNNTAYPMGVYYRRTSLSSIGKTVIGDCANPFDEATRLTVIAPDDKYHVPLSVCFHAQIYFLPVHLTNHALSLEGITWSNVTANPDTMLDYVYTDSEKSLFCFKVCWKSDGIVTITPPLLVKSVLPVSCQFILPNHQIIHLEPGEGTHVYSVDLRTEGQFAARIPSYMGLAWCGNVPLGPDSKEKLIMMQVNQDTDDGNRQWAFNVSITRAQTDVFLLYAPYWLLNRTGLMLAIRGTRSNVIQEWVMKKPFLFSFQQLRTRTVRLQVLSSSWSSSFSLDTVGCNGLIICRDNERNKKFQVIMECIPCHVEPTLCRMIRFLPYITVENGCKRHIRYMEDNEKADLWVDIAPGQISPFWPDTESMKMIVRLPDSPNKSVAFPLTVPHVTALRTDIGFALTVEVTGGDLRPFRVLLRPYRVGDAPVRIDNLCVDLFLRIRQKDCPQVALLSPDNCLLYTWDDPSKERILLWSIYNNAEQEVTALWEYDGYGEERLTLRSVRPKSNKKSPESSDSSDDENSSSATDSKEIRKDTVVVYWSSFVQNGQRILLITEDERLARKARRGIEAERSSVELFCALYTCSISLLNYDGNKVLREVAHLTINSSPAQWELNVGDRCKTLTPDVSSWLETNYLNNINQPKIDDLIQVDMSKMQMIRPLFGILRRKQRAGLWIQYRSSKQLSVIQMHIYRMQLDDQRMNTATPCVFCAAPGATINPALEVTMLWRHRPNDEWAIKFASMSVQDHTINVDCDWLIELFSVGRYLWPPMDTQGKMRHDITRIHAKFSRQSQILEELNKTFVELLQFGSICWHVTIWPGTIDYGLKPLWPVPDIFTALLSAIKLMSAPITNTLIKFTDCELNHERFSFHRFMAHYQIQLLQQLHVAVFGVNVLAAPSAKTDREERKEIVMFPEEFSKALSLEAETKMGRQLLVDRTPKLPDALLQASRSFPLGCLLTVLGLGISRGTVNLGWEGFSRGPGRDMIALLGALQSETSSKVPDPLNMFLEQINRVGKNILSRRRPPMIVNPIKGVRPFSMLHSQGAMLLYGLGRGRYITDTYWDHSALKANHSSCLLITLKRLLFVEQIGKSNTFDVTWTCALGSIQSVVISNAVIKILSQTGNEFTERKISCWDPQVLTYLYERIKEAIDLSANLLD